MSEMEKIYIICPKRNMTEGRFRKTFKSLENVDEDQTPDWEGLKPKAPLFTELEPFSALVGGEEFSFEATTKPPPEPSELFPFPAHIEWLTIGFDHHLDIAFGDATDLVSGVARTFFTGMGGIIGLVIHDLTMGSVASYDEMQKLTSDIFWFRRDVAELVGTPRLAQLGPLIEFEGGYELRLGPGEVGEPYDWERVKSVLEELWGKASILQGPGLQRLGREEQDVVEEGRPKLEFGPGYNITNLRKIIPLKEEIPPEWAISDAQMQRVRDMGVKIDPTPDMELQSIVKGRRLNESRLQGGTKPQMEIYHKALTLVAKKKYRKAMKLLDKHIRFVLQLGEDDDDQVDLLEVNGLLKWHMGKIEEATMYFLRLNRALTKRSGQEDPRTLHARLLVDKLRLEAGVEDPSYVGMKVLARRTADEELERSSESKTRYLRHWAQELRNEGHPSAALAWAEENYRYHKSWYRRWGKYDDPDPVWMIADTLRLLGRFKESSKYVREYVEKSRALKRADFDPNKDLDYHPEHPTFADVLRRVGDYEGAIDILEKCIWKEETLNGKTFATTADRLSQKAEVLIDWGRLDEASDILDRVKPIARKWVKTYPATNARYLIACARLERSRGDPQTAETMCWEALGHCLKVEYPDRVLISMVILTLAETFIDRGEHNRARIFIEMAILIPRGTLYDSRWVARVARDLEVSIPQPS